MMDLHCENGIKFAELHDGILEVKCRSRRCGAKRGETVVIHSFSAYDGSLIETRVFRDPTFQNRRVTA
jgi:hypothetical protein